MNSSYDFLLAVRLLAEQESKNELYSLPKLNYSLGDLEPYIDTKTMEVHYNILHQNYVTTANSCIEQLRHLEPDVRRGKVNTDLISALTRKLNHNISGHVLHSFFWSCLSPLKTQPSEVLLMGLEKFSGPSGLLEHFKALIPSLEGAGWAILGYCTESTDLQVFTLENHNKLLPACIHPILVIDLWEHAYFLKHKADKLAYLNDIWQVLNWKEISQRYKVQVTE